jgi:hypothetical protein
MVANGTPWDNHVFQHEMYQLLVPELDHVLFHLVMDSADSRLVAAGNLMGEVRVWSVESGEQVGVFQSKDFTSWGIIKSHCYLVGVFGIRFSPDGNELIICGMGDMRDPMAGNGRQLWQRWNWREGKMVGQTKEKQLGEGLMEALVMHPSGESFLMGGRLRGGEWNAALRSTKFRIDGGFSRSISGAR